MKPESLENLSEEEIAGMASTYQALINNPETRDLALRMTKKVNPALSIPEIELVDRANAAFKKQQEEIDTMKVREAERAAKDLVNTRRAELADQGFTKADITAIEKIMVDEQIPNYQTAANYYKGQQQLAAATSNTGPHNPAGGNWKLPENALAAGKGGKAGLKTFARNEAAAAMAELQAKGGRINIH